MKSVKKIIAVGGIVAALAMTSVTAFAASSYKTPAEAVAALTGKTTESVIADRVAGKNYGTIANEAGKLEEFKQELIELKKDILAQRVTDGKITQEQADATIKAIEENQATCDGTGTGSCGLGVGNKNANGTGAGRGMGRGCGLRDGSCTQN